MTDPDTVARELVSRWPNGKLTDEFLDDLVPRLQPYQLPDIVAALESHKARSKWPPEWSELLSFLLASARAGRPAMYGTGEERPYPLILAERLKLPPAQAVLVYGRQLWTRYASAAVQRQHGPQALPDGWERIEAERARIVRITASQLTAAGCCPDWALAVSALVTALPADFHQLLDQIGANGVQLPARLPPPTRQQLAPIYGLQFRPMPALLDADAKHRADRALARWQPPTLIERPAAAAGGGR